MANVGFIGGRGIFCQIADARRHIETLRNSGDHRGEKFTSHVFKHIYSN